MRFMLIPLVSLMLLPALNAEEAPPAPKVTVPVYANNTCPVMGKRASKALYQDTIHGRIYICCAGCQEEILADPDAAYEAAYPVRKKAGNKICPVTGEKLPENPTMLALQGYDIALSSEKAIEKARAEPQSTLTKALKPKVIDLGNRTCPVTGEPVEADSYCLIGDDLVRLSSMDCVEQVKEDPAATLKKAKAIVASQKKKPAEEETPRDK